MAFEIKSNKENLTDLVDLKNDVNCLLNDAPECQIVDYYDNLRNQIDLSYESAIEHLNRLRASLLGQIDREQLELLEATRTREKRDALEKFEQDSTQLIRQVEQLEEKCSLLGIDSELNKQIVKMRINLVKSKLKGNEIVFGKRPLLEYKSFENDFNEGKNYLGYINQPDQENSSATTKDLKSLKKYCKYMSCSELYDDMRSFRADSQIYLITILENENIITITRSNQIKRWNPMNGELIRDYSQLYQSAYLNRPIGALTSIPSICGFAIGTNREIIVFRNYDRLNTVKCFVNVYTTLVKHDGLIDSLVALPEEKMASASQDLTIKIWSFSKCLAVINEAHESSISSLVSLSANRLASCSWDRTLKIWNINDGQLIHTFNDHLDRICAMISLADSDDLLATISQDRTIKIFDTLKRELLRSIEHDVIECEPKIILLLNGNLALNSDDRLIVINPIDGSKVEEMKLDDHVNSDCLTALKTTGCLAYTCQKTNQVTMIRSLFR